MDRIVVDSDLCCTLPSLDSRLELCDLSGRVVGYFVPASEHERLLYAWARAEFSDDEIERARAESGGFSLAEVLAELHEA